MEKEGAVISQKQNATKHYDALEARGLTQPNSSRSVTLDLLEQRVQALREYWTPEVAAEWKKLDEKERSALILGFNPTLPEKVNQGFRFGSLSLLFLFP